jgi:hypothetical protein
MEAKEYKRSLEEGIINRFANNPKMGVCKKMEMLIEKWALPVENMSQYDGWSVDTGHQNTQYFGVINDAGEFITCFVDSWNESGWFNRDWRI